MPFVFIQTKQGHRLGSIGALSMAMNVRVLVRLEW